MRYIFSPRVELSKALLYSHIVCAIRMRWCFSSWRLPIVTHEQDTVHRATLSWYLLTLAATLARSL